MNLYITFLIVALASFPMALAQAETLATCYAPKGKAYYSDEGRWSDDGINAGEFLFTVDGKGNPNLLFKDVTGKTIDAAADGGTVAFSFVNTAQRSFGIVVLYSGAGVVETYNVVTGEGGTRSVYWTANRAGLFGPGKISAMVGRCD